MASLIQVLTLVAVVGALLLPALSLVVVIRELSQLTLSLHSHVLDASHVLIVRLL
jgi:hypothetical protein